MFFLAPFYGIKVTPCRSSHTRFIEKFSLHMNPSVKVCVWLIHSYRHYSIFTLFFFFSLTSYTSCLFIMIFFFSFNLYFFFCAVFFIVTHVYQDFFFPFYFLSIFFSFIIKSLTCEMSLTCMDQPQWEDIDTTLSLHRRYFLTCK